MLKPAVVPRATGQSSCQREDLPASGLVLLDNVLCFNPLVKY